MSFSLQATPTDKYRVFDFSGGLNNKYSNAIIAENEASDLLNVVIEERGHFYQRPGVVIENSYPSKPNVNIVQTLKFITTTNDRHLFVVFGDGTIKTFKNDVETFDLGLLDENNIAITHSNRPFSYFTYENKFYFGNKTDGWFIYGTGAPTAKRQSTIPYCDFGIMKNQRAYYALDKDDQSIVHFSHIGDPTNVDIIQKTGENSDSVGGIFYFDSKSNGITGLTMFLGEILVFKSDSVFVINGNFPSDFSIEKLNIAIGCVAPRTLVAGNNAVYYLGYDGLYFIHSPHQDYIETKPVSDKITPEFDGEELSSSHALFYKSKYYLFMGGKTLIYDERLNAWIKWDLDMTTAIFDDYLNKVIMGNEKGYVYTFDSTKMNDEYTPEVKTAIRSFYQTGYNGLGEPETTKRFKYSKIFYRPNDKEGSYHDILINIDYFEQVKKIDCYMDALIWEDDGLEEENNWDEYWGDIKQQDSELLRFGGSGEFISFKFENNRLDESLRIHGFVLGFKKKPKVR